MDWTHDMLAEVRRLSRWLTHDADYSDATFNCRLERLEAYLLRRMYRG
jgi:hypothetical protein